MMSEVLTSPAVSDPHRLARPQTQHKSVSLLYPSLLSDLRWGARHHHGRDDIGRGDDTRGAAVLVDDDGHRRASSPELDEESTRTLILTPAGRSGDRRSHE